MGHNTHKFIICTSCRHKGADCRPGYDLIVKLRASIVAQEDSDVRVT